MESRGQRGWQKVVPQSALRAGCSVTLAPTALLNKSPEAVSIQGSVTEVSLSAQPELELFHHSKDCSGKVQISFSA